MHEYSIVSSLITICLEQLKIHNAHTIKQITISVGERANIEKSLLLSAFEILKADYKELSGAKIAIITENLLLECKECKHNFHSLDNPTCPICNSHSTIIIQGRDIKLENLELTTDNERSKT